MTNEKKTEKRAKPPMKAAPVDQAARVPPHNLDMERALLCSALIDPNGMARVVEVVDEKSFYDRRHNLIFAAMIRLFSSASPIDVLTVSEELERSKDLEAVGGDPYLAGLSMDVATSTHIEHYARIVSERAALRALISSSTQVAYEAYEAGDVKDLLDRAMQQLFDISAGQQEGGFEPIRPILTRLHEHLDRLHGRTDGSLTGISTGFSQLNDYTSGFQNGDLIVIAGRPSMGKTAFGLDVARHAALVCKVPVAFFSLEMASMAIAMRLIAADARLDLHKLRSGKLAERDWPKLSFSTANLTEMPFFIDDSGSLTIMDLRARARLLKQKHDIGLVFIDYMQLMQPPVAGSREQEVAKISRAMKALARELDVPVVALSQLSRAVETRGEDARPQLSDLRDSGAIEQDADVVMFIHRNLAKRDKLEREAYEEDTDESRKEELKEEVEKLERTADIIIRKQRNGPTGSFKLTFMKTFACFEDQASMKDSDLAAAHAPISVVEEGEEEVPF